MNKLFTKVATLSIGLAMAIGVGVAVGSNAKETVEVKATMDSLDKTVTCEKVETIAAGDKIVIVASNADYALGTNNTNNRIAKAFTRSTGKATYNSEVAVLTVAGNSTDGFTLHDGDGYLVNNYYKSGSKNQNLLNTVADPSNTSVYQPGSWRWDFSWKNNVATISSRATKSNASPTAAQKLMRYNSGGYFSCYNSGQDEALTVYKVPAATTPTITVSSTASIDLGADSPTVQLSVTKSGGASGTVTWSIYSGSDYVSLPAENTGDSIVITGEAVGTAVVRATCSDCTDPADCTITVVNVEHAGTLADPYSVADAILVANRAGSTDPGVDCYVKGYIINKTYYTSTGTATFDLGDTADATTKLYCYKTYGDYDGENLISFDDTRAASAIVNGQQIIVVGSPFLYNGNKAEINEGYAYSKSPSSLTSTAASGSFNAGDEPTVSQLGITVTVTYDDGTQANVTSSAVVSSGLPLVKGSNTLTISYTESHAHTGEDKTASCNVTVSDVVQPVTSVNITSSVSQVNIGKTITLTAEALPETANNRTITWSSADANIATVDSSTGVVTGVAAGSVSITASSNNNKTASVTILVKDPEDIPTDLTITGTLTKSAYYVGETFSPAGLTVTLTMAHSGDSDVTNFVEWDTTTLSSVGEHITVTASYTLDETTVTDSVEVRVVNRTITSFDFTAPTKTTYTEADSALVLTGMSATAHFNLNDTQDITASIQLSAVDFTNTDEEQTVYATYTFNQQELNVGSFKVKVNPLSCPLTKGQKYIITTYDTKNAKYEELSSITTTGTTYGAGAEYTTKYASGAYVLTAVQGVNDNTVSLKNSSNKYLSWSSGNSLTTSDEVNANSSWTVSYDTTTTSGTAYIMFANVADSARVLWWNNNNPRFACYTGKNISVSTTTSGYNGVQLFEYEYCIAGNFVEAYMYPSISQDDDGADDNYTSCEAYYEDARDAFNLLSLEVRTKLSDSTFEFYPYYQRLLAWAEHNHESINSEGKLSAKINFSILSDSSNSTTLVIILVSTVGVAAMGGYFLFKKKKQN